MNVILFGATGQLGRHIAGEVKRRGHRLTIAVRNLARVNELSLSFDKVISCSFADDAAMSEVLKDHDVVISALGKNVSPSDRRKPGFADVDLGINRIILKYAILNAVRKFIYISAFHAEKYPELEYFRVHEQFANELKKSGVNYSIIKPPSLFSAYLEMIPMARKGMLFTFGSGDKRTNPIFDGDVARIAVESILQSNVEIEAGGMTTYTRSEIADIIQQAAAPAKKVRSIPLAVLTGVLPLVRLFDKNTFDKLAFFSAVMRIDTIAPAVGKTDFKWYITQETRPYSRSSG